MSKLLTQTASPSSDVLFREVEGEAVLLNTKTGIYFGLEPMGVEIWRLLSKRSPLNKIADALTKIYAVDLKTCQEDLLRFVGQLEKNELIRVHAAK